MPYSQFTVEKIKTDFGAQIIESFGIFANLPEAPSSQFLTDLLSKFVPLALSIDYFLNNLAQLLGILRHCAGE
jgi:hypothetical protein